MIRFLKRKSEKPRPLLTILAAGVILLFVTAGVVILRTMGRTIIQFDIHQNKDLIFISNFSEPPQFAIWIQNEKTGKMKTVFVTSRVSKGDWEGKANVPVALPRWYDLFRGENKAYMPDENDEFSAVTGATPRDDYFSVRIEVQPGSSWICWIEMNLAGDFNDAYPEYDINTLQEDEFSCGQPSLLFKGEITADVGMKSVPALVGQSVWEKGINRIEPVNEGVTTARSVFDDMLITVIRPKPKLIDKNRISGY